MASPSVGTNDTASEGAPAFAPLEAAPLEFLLAEAKERYRAEHDKFNQTYTRAGIYLGVVAVYVNAMVKVLDRPPPVTGSWVLALFHGAVAGLLLAVAGSATCIVGALVGRPFGFVPEPASWVEFVDKQLRPFLIETGQYSSEGEALALELRRQTLERYASAIDINVSVNRARAAWLHRCGYLTLAGLVLAVVAAAAYAWLSFVVQPGR